MKYIKEYKNIDFDEFEFEEEDAKYYFSILFLFRNMSRMTRVSFSYLKILNGEFYEVFDRGDGYKEELLDENGDLFPDYGKLINNKGDLLVNPMSELKDYLLSVKDTSDEELMKKYNDIQNILNKELVDFPDRTFKFDVKYKYKDNILMDKNLNLEYLNENFDFEEDFEEIEPKRKHLGVGDSIILNKNIKLYEYPSSYSKGLSDVIKGGIFKIESSKRIFGKLYAVIFGGDAGKRYLVGISELSNFDLH